MNKSDFYTQDSDILPRYKIIILGLTSTGKTKLLTRYQHGFYQDTGMTTLTVDFTIKKNSKAIFCYYDTAGQQNYRAIVDHYYKGSDACIIVYDVTSFKSFQQIPYYYNKIKQMTQNSLIYLVGCKSDLQHKITQQDIAKKYKGIKHFVTSAKLNKNVTSAFQFIQNQLITLRPKSQRGSSILKPIDFQNGVNGNRRIKKNQCCGGTTQK